MTTIIRRYRRRHRALLRPAVAAIIAALVLAWLFTIVWKKGGPQPVHQIVIAIPAPQMPAAGRRA